LDREFKIKEIDIYGLRNEKMEGVIQKMISPLDLFEAKKFLDIVWILMILSKKLMNWKSFKKFLIINITKFKQ